MNTPFFIAKRYLFSKKTQNVINIISGISVFGIMVSTAAMVIILSGFNGIEGVVLKMFSAFESDIQITAAQSKTFDQSFLPDEVFQVDGMDHFTPVIEEIAIVKNNDNFIIGTIKGVEAPFLKMADMNEHLLDGMPQIEDEYGALALIGGGAIQNLDGYIYQLQFENQYEVFTIYSPNRGKKIKANKLQNIDGFTTSTIRIGGAFNYNKDVDENYLVVPFTFARDIFEYDNEITKLEMDFEPGTDLNGKKAELQLMLGPSFKVETNREQNKLIYETSESEKLLTILLLGFIFFLATFNMVASITMLVIEKRSNLNTLNALGAKMSQMRQIFFFEGLLINGLGLLLGLAVGYGVCFLQMQFGLLPMENGVVEAFPVSVEWTDLMTILVITLTIGTLAAYLPSRFLMKRIVKQ